MHGDLSVTSEISSDLALRARIEDLHARYVHLIDDDQLEELTGLFATDGLYRVQTRENHELDLPLSLIYCDNAAMIADRITALRTANIFEPHVYCHMTSALRILSRDGKGWRTRSNFSVIRTMSEGDCMIFACGKYLDHIVEVDGALRFKERVAVLDSRRIDTLLVIPV
jgi:anthranilate 1,2-dioxygenase small subunit